MITDTSTAEQTGGLQQTARDLASEVGQTAERQADTAMTQAGSTVGEVASALRSASGDLTQQQPQLGRVGEMAASRMEDVASYLDAHEPREVLDEAERIARQQPALVIAGGLALGLVLGRLLRTATSSTMNGSGRSNGDWYGQGLRGSGGTGIRSSSGGSSYGGGSAYADGSGYDRADASTDDAASGTIADEGDATTAGLQP